MNTALNLVWYAAILSEIAVLFHLVHTRLYRHWPFLTLFIAASIGKSGITIWFDPRTWLYARIWAYTDWLVLPCVGLMVFEILRELWRYFLADRRAVGAWFLVIALVTAALAVWTIRFELPSVHWDQPLVVQLTIIAHRVLATWFAAAIAGAWLSLYWSARWRRNLSRHLAVTTCILSAGAMAQAASLVTLSVEVRIMASIAWSGVTFFGCLGWLTLHPTGEAENVPDHSEVYGLIESSNRRMAKALFSFALRQIWQRNTT